MASGIANVFLKVQLSVVTRDPTLSQQLLEFPPGHACKSLSLSEGKDVPPVKGDRQLLKEFLLHLVRRQSKSVQDFSGDHQGKIFAHRRPSKPQSRDEKLRTVKSQESRAKNSQESRVERQELRTVKSPEPEAVKSRETRDKSSRESSQVKRENTVNQPPDLGTAGSVERCG